MMHTSRTVAVVVAYRPDPKLLDRLLEALAPQVSGGIVVNNGSSLPLSEELLAKRNFVCHHFNDNRGIAHALNFGIEWAKSQGAEYLIAFDQDSEPAAGMVNRLRTALEDLRGHGIPVGAVGPQKEDRRTGRRLPFLAPIRSRRVQVLPKEDGVVEVDHLITSGCLMPLSVLEAVGPMKTELFIDYVDVEWSLRCQAAGYRLYGVGGACLTHAIGDSVVHCRGRDITMHSPVRHYYLMRNGVYLQSLDHIPAAWKHNDRLQLLKKFLFFALVARPSHQHVWHMLRGIRDGFQGRLGPFA